MRVQARYQLLTSALIALVVSAIAILVMHTQGRLLREQALQRLEAVTGGVERVAKEAFESRDRLMLMSYLLFLQKTYPELAFARVDVGSGRVTRIGAEDGDLIFIDRDVPLNAQIAGEGVASCAVRLGFNRAAIDAQIKEGRDRLLGWTAGLAGLFLLFGLVAAAWLSRLLTEPVKKLAEAIEVMASGNLDVSVPVRSKDELGTLTEGFNHMAARLRELLESREDILHTLTHEINTPLSGLKGYLELWQDQKLETVEGKNSEVIRIMAAAVLRMENSLVNALKLFRGESLSEPMIEEELSLDAIFREVIAIYAPIAQVNGVRIVPLPDSQQVRIFTQDEQVRRIISNLISNAIKYAPPNGEVSMGISDKESETLFYVRNTGRGIPAADIPHLFTKFYRSVQDRQKGGRIPGTGLGLSIVKKAVDTLGGRVWVESYENEFTLFMVLLPKKHSVA